jgi:hypothetical protein
MLARFLCTQSSLAGIGKHKKWVMSCDDITKTANFMFYVMCLHDQNAPIESGYMQLVKCYGQIDA